MNRIGKWCWLCCIIPAMNASSQDLVVTYGDKVIPAAKSEDAWSFAMDGEDYIIIRRANLSKRLSTMQARIDSQKIILAACDNTIAKHEGQMGAANAHIAELTAGNEMSDSLYREFKGLYQDCKKLVGLNTFGIAAGGNLVSWTGAGRRWGAGGGIYLNNVLFSQNIEVLGLLGDGHWSIVGTLRWALF